MRNPIKSQTQLSAKIVLPLCVAIVMWGGWHFHQGLDKVALWPNELVLLSESWKEAGVDPVLPHLEYKSPAYVWSLEKLHAEPTEIMKARSFSWIVGTLAIAMVIAAGWALFSPAEALAAGLLAVGSLRMLSAAQSIGVDGFLLLWQGLTVALFGIALRSNGWFLWIAMLLVSILAALSGFQTLALLVAVAVIGGAYVYNKGRGAETGVSLPVWQYLSTVPIALVLSSIWVVTWVLASRDVNPALGKPPIMNPRYVSFVYRYLLGDAVWAVRLLGFAAVVGIIGSLKKRVVRLEKLRRVYVDKRSQRPMFFLLFWLMLGLPSINLLLFNARRPQDPVVLNILVLPLLLIIARGIVLIAEAIKVGAKRVLGLRLPMLAVLLVVGIPLCWFSQDSGRRAYGGYRTGSRTTDHWQDAAEFLRPRIGLGTDILISPPWAGSLVNGMLSSVFSNLQTVVPVLGSQIDSLIRESPSVWSIVYQDEIYPPVPDRVRRAMDNNLEEVARFRGSYEATVVILATPWLHVSESQWAMEQEKLAMGGEEGIEAKLALTRLYLDAGNREVAGRELQAIVAASPNRYDALMELAGLREQEGKKGVAANLYRRATRADTSSAKAFFRLGRVNVATGRMAAAVVNLEEALRLDPNELAAAQLLVAAYRKVGKEEEAQAMEETIEAMGGKIVLNYEFGRIVAVKALELPTGSWELGDEVELGLDWSCVRSARGEFRPDLYVVDSKSRLILKSPRGGWKFGIADSGFVMGQQVTDLLPIRFTYGALPSSYPDFALLCLDVLDGANQPLPVVGRNGERVPRAVIGRLVSWRKSGRLREEVEAEEMEQRSGFELPGGINVTEVGLMQNFRFPGGPVILEITARGVPAGGGWPRMIVELSGQVIDELEVNDRSWKAYRVSIAPAPGARPVRIRFPNDYVNPTTGEDRNLVVDKVGLIEEEIQFRLESAEDI